MLSAYAKHLNVLVIEFKALDLRREVRFRVFSQCRLNVLGGLNPRFPISGGREFHKPLVVHIDGAKNIGLPEIGLISIYARRSGAASLIPIAFADPE